MTQLGHDEERIAAPLTDELTKVIYDAFLPWSHTDAQNDALFQKIVDLILKYKDDKEVLEALKIYATES